MKIKEVEFCYNFDFGGMLESKEIEIIKGQNSIEKKVAYGGMAWTEVTILGCEGTQAKASESYVYQDIYCDEYYACMSGEGLLLVEEEGNTYHVHMKKHCLYLICGGSVRSFLNVKKEAFVVCVFGKDNDFKDNKKKNLTCFQYRKENKQWNFFNKQSEQVQIPSKKCDCTYDFSTEKIKEISKSEKTYGQIKHVYKAVDSQLSNKQILYKVFAYENEAKPGRINYGITIMSPIRIKDECNVTRGHVHVDSSMTEVYFGLHGEGLLLLKDEKGEVFFQKVYRGSIHFIDGRWAHRLINVGEVELHVGAYWNANEKQDYETVEKEPFEVRVFIRDGELQIEKE